MEERNKNYPLMVKKVYMHLLQKATFPSNGGMCCYKEEKTMNNEQETKQNKYYKGVSE